MDINKEIGLKIKYYRKKKKMSVTDLAKAICKSKSTVSKYESGQISVDISTLYEISSVLDVHIYSLLYIPPSENSEVQSDNIPLFFRNLNRFYMYYYDGRINQIIPCVLDIISKQDENSYNIMMYMNVNDYEKYHICENTYSGQIFHFDALSSIVMQNEEMFMEKYQISIPAPYLNTPEKMALAYGVSSRPLMPNAAKVLISKTIQTDMDHLKNSLVISKEDIRLLKLYNFFTIM